MPFRDGYCQAYYADRSGFYRCVLAPGHCYEIGRDGKPVPHGYKRLERPDAETQREALRRAGLDDDEIAAVEAISLRRPPVDGDI